MINKRCCFAGHGKISYTQEIYDKLINLLNMLIVKENVSEFWVGNYGEFDSLCAKAVKNLKEKYPHIRLNLVIPYLTADINENREIYYKKYDSILVADMPENTPKKVQILKCNEYMVKTCEFMICYILYSWGGAAKMLEYAKKKKHIQIFNIASGRLA